MGTRDGFPAVLSKFFALSGGLDLASPATMVSPGRCSDAQNYEPDSVNGGYARIRGFERFDGRTAPTANSNYWIMTASITGTVAVGNTLTGATSGASGKVLLVSGTKIVLGRVSGTYVSGENLQVGAVTQAVATSGSTQNGESSISLDATYRKAAADDWRADIQKVPGSGSILGVWLYNDTVYAFRNNAGGTAAVMYKSTGSGWSAITMPYELPYSLGYMNCPDATAIKGLTSGATATVNRNVMRAGTYGTTAVGVLNIAAPTGTFQASEQIVSQANATVTISIASPGVVTWASHGLAVGDCVIFTTTGALPTGLSINTPYYVISAGYTSGAFQLATTPGGTAINTSGTQSGTHTGQRGYGLASATATQIALAASGRYEFVNYAFAGSSSSLRMYGCDGVNKAFEFDGTTYVQIRTGMATDAPSHIAAHKHYLWLSFFGSAQFSGVGNPYAWSVVLGSGEIAVGDTITAMLPQPGDAASAAMAIFSASSARTLYGTGASTWQLSTASPTTGTAAYTAQWIGQATTFSQRGIQQLQQTINFGDFQFATMSGLIQPLINSKLGTATASAAYKERNQYRVFFSDGTAIAMGLSSSEVTGFMPINYGMPIRCYCVGNKSDGREYCYFGGDDGYVYQDNVGTSFDGAAYEAWSRLAFNHMGMPRYRKRYRRSALDMVVENIGVVQISYELGAGSGDAASGTTYTLNAIGAGGYWDQFIWDRFIWDAPAVTTSSIALCGTEKSISMLFYSNSATDGIHSIQGITYDYSVRRLER